MGANTLYAWLRDKKYWVYAASSARRQHVNNNNNNSNSKLTHVFLDGGRASVPDSDLPAFWGTYVQALRDHPDTPQHVVERVVDQKTFKMFLDVDIAADTLVVDADADADQDDRDAINARDALVQKVQDLLLQSLPAELRQGEVVVMRAKPANGQSKQGLHVVWNDVLVSGENATALRARIVESCCAGAAGFGLSEEEDAWSTIIDASVYRTGLRMPFSCKGVPADKCRVYAPHVLLLLSPSDPPHVVKMFEACDVDAIVCEGTIAACSIHPDPRRQGLYKTVHATASLNTRKRKSRQSRNRAILSDDDEDDQDDHDDCEDEDAEDTAEDDEAEEEVPLTLTLDMERKIRARLPEVYKTASMPTSYLHENRAVVYIDSRYCHNLQGEHKNNRVYLVLDASGIRQKCFCKCDTTEGRVTRRPCSEFEKYISKADPLRFKKKLQKLHSQQANLEDADTGEPDVERAVAAILEPPPPPQEKRRLRRKGEQTGQANNESSAMAKDTGSKATKSTKRTNSKATTKRCPPDREGAEDKKKRKLRHRTRNIEDANDALMFWCRTVAE